MEPGEKTRAIYFRPVGVINEQMLQWLLKGIGGYLNIATKAMKPLAIPEGSFERNRNQYNSTKILKEILKEVPEDATKVLGLTERDLCIPILTFVFGEAQLSGTVSIVSFCRLRQEFYGIAPDENLFRERAHKECLHELGHTFGLIHCPDSECVMYLSNSVVDVDRKKRTYCRSCFSAVRSAAERGR